MTLPLIAVSGRRRRAEGAHDGPPQLDDLQVEVYFVDRDLPVLAICRGMQLLNVHLGGMLHQHLTAHPLGVEGAHDVAFAEDSMLHGIYGAHCPVNSLHHQSVAAPGKGLTCVGHSPDGVVEAVELPGRDVVGVQWHPEQLRTPDPIFDWLVTVAARSTVRICTQ